LVADVLRGEVVVMLSAVPNVESSRTPRSISRP
jgi:hypothetical protein